MDETSRPPAGNGVRIAPVANPPDPSRAAARPEHLTKSQRGEPVGFLEAIAEGLFEEMERDERVLLLGEDVGVYGGAFKLTAGFQEYFGPNRVFDTPISEAGFTGAAAGAAHMGMRPVVEMQFMDFISSAYNVVTNYIATSLWRGAGPMPLVIRGPVGAGARSGAFHAQSVEMAFFHTPGLKIVYPSTPRDAKGLIKAAVRDDNPVIFEEHKLLYRDPRVRELLPPEDYVIALGKARTVRAGRHLTMVTYGRMVHVCVDAAERLETEDGLQTEILDLRTLLPFDIDAITGSLRRTNRLLIVHEDTRTGGIAGEISMRVNERAFEWLDAPITRVTAIDTPIPYAPDLEDYFLPQVQDVVTAARYLAGY